LAGDLFHIATSAPAFAATDKLSAKSI